MTSADIELIVEGIHDYANDILRNGGEDEELLISLYDVMGEIRKVIDGATHQDLDSYCQKYNGFYRYMRLLEQLAEGIADGTISVPE